MTLWLVGGVDPTGGAGLHRDHWTARAIAPEIAVRCIATALTHQGGDEPARAWSVGVATLARTLAAAPRPTAIKLGLVPGELSDALADAIAGVPTVLDPVLAASDGGNLGADPSRLLALAARCVLVTPNRAEAVALAGSTDAARVAQRLGTAVLVKDGHGDDPHRVVDVLVAGGESHRFERPRQSGADVRGTGCALATAIAVGLVQGKPLVDAVARAITWLDAERRDARPGPDGRPHLPVRRS